MAESRVRDRLGVLSAKAVTNPCQDGLGPCEWRALRAIVSATLATREAPDVMRRLARATAKLLGADSAVFWVIDEHVPQVIPRAGYRIPKHLVDNARPITFAELPPVMLDAVRGRRTAWVVDAGTDPRFVGSVVRAAGVRGLVAVPVGIKDRVFGCLVLCWWTAIRASDDEELRALEAIASHAALALENRRLGREVERERQVARAAEERYRSLLDHIPAPTFRSTLDGRMLDCNDAFVRVLGHASRAELLSLKLGTLFVEPADHAALLDRLQADGIVSMHQLRWRRQDGSPFWAVVTLRLVGEGPSAHLDGVAIDITDRKRAEEAVREREAQLRRLGDNLPDGVIYQVVRRRDGSNYFPYMSAGLERAFGVSPADAARNASAVYERILPDDRRRLRAAADESIRTSTPFDVECRVRTRDGTERWLNLRGRPSPLPDGATLWDAVALDITDRKRTDDALRESERSYRLLADHVTDVIFTTDLMLRPTYISPSVRGITGYSVEEAMERPLAERLTPPSLDLVRRTMVEKVGSGGAHATDHPTSTLLELEFRCKDGSTVWTEVHATLMRGADGRPTGVLGVMRDISRRKATEERLRRIERRLAVSQERERLAGALHDGLSAVLFSIGLKIEWCLQRLPQRSRVTPRLAEIKADSGRIMREMRALILQLAGGSCAQGSACERFADLVAEFKELSGIDAGLRVVGDLATVDAQTEELLHRILQEALVNVAKHAQATRIEIRLEVAVNEVRFEVSDDGIGPSADFARLAAAPGHVGIRSMRERIQAVGGWLEVGAGGEKGFGMRGALPVSVLTT